MQYSFRLAELLGHVPDPRRRPGTIKSIVEYTGLDRHQVAALLKNEVKYIPLKALSRLCDYLIEHGHATAEQLPGALFAVEPENFWELLARRNRMELCVGVRRDESTEVADVSYVVASDSVLLGELLNGVTTLGGTAKLKKPNDGSGAQLAADTIPQPEYLKQSLVWSPGQATFQEMAERAEAVYDDFSESKGDKALVGIGSTKSNPIVEIVLSRLFSCDPFETQDEVDDPTERSIPFYLRYRDNDPQTASCVGGLQLSKGNSDQKPGIYYEDAKGDWIQCSAAGAKEEVAFVFYVHRESQGRLEMVMGGFSGKATRLLARALATRAEDFWPPQYEAQGIQVGAFIVQFDVPSNKDIDILRTDLVANSKVTPIPTEALERRLSRN
ncbi:MAG: helix-turn-helix transcriptional regulator [Mariniblastus sp.]|nr:helix-turn-helix transcriptional regulator [Mariniblastus sp.]